MAKDDIIMGRNNLVNTNKYLRLKFLKFKNSKNNTIELHKYCNFVNQNSDR